MGGFVMRVRIDQRGFLLEDRLEQERHNALSLRKPLSTQFAEFPLRLVLIQEQKPSHPAIAEGQPIELIQKPWPSGRGETPDREHPKVVISHHRCETTG